MSREKNIIPIESLLPQKLNIIPLMNRPIFPGIFTPLVINDVDDVKSINQAYEADGFIGLNLVKNEAEQVKAGDLYKVGCAVKIVKKINLPDGGVNILVSAQKRFKIKKVLNEVNPIVAAVQYLEEIEEKNSEMQALARAMLSAIKELSQNNPLFSEELRFNIVNLDEPGKIADFITGILNIPKENQQKVLETLDIRKRMEDVFVLIKNEQELLQIQRKIQIDLNNRVEKNQRDYFLREELKSIKEELGLSSDPKVNDEQKFKKLIESFNFKDEVKEVIDSEYEKFCMTEPMSPEYILSRNYLETTLSLPWKNNDLPEYDLEKAQAILDKDHFGLEDVKTRIIEYLSVRKLKKDTKGSIILLIGPPGVGKTSIGKSIASAMNKPFFRFSVGGMRDEAEIKGHRRTYIGAMPGKIIQGLKIVKTNAPVFMIDEVDKMGQSYQGDPAGALLEVLDPEQNVSFRDHYLDLPFDLSNVIFILTANTPDSIPRPLMDRMEIIKLSGYINSEKAEIAKKYLIPKSLKKHGLKKSQVSYDKNSLLYIANSYAREAGVRNLEKNLDKIHRKIAAEIVCGKRGEKETFKADKISLEKFLGKPVFREDDIKTADIAGTALGLAWTNMGGDTLLIETACMPGKPNFKMTGQAGDVMKESAAIALSWTRKFITAQGLQPEDWFEKNTIHLHLPEGATPKDGPSAGITMTTALVSLLSGKKIKRNIAMTGELSLTGQVLPIGGLKEKTIAARRNGIKEIIIPNKNMRELEEIPEQVKEGIIFYPVKRIEEVLDIVFEGKILKNIYDYKLSHNIKRKAASKKKKE